MMNDRYLGNINIPRAGAKKNWTAEQIKEYQKCMLDPVHFAEKYFKIVHVDHGLIPMILFDYQKEVINAYLTNKEIVMNTSRQAGKCQKLNTLVKIRNKETGEELYVTAEEFRSILKGTGPTEL